jgi:hypothetical protein
MVTRRQFTVIWITEDLRIGMDQVSSPDPLAAIDEAGVDLTGGADVVVIAGEAYDLTADLPRCGVKSCTRFLSPAGTCPQCSPASCHRRETG